MDNTSSAAWFINICNWLYKRRGFIWGTLVLGVALNVFATLLLTPLPWAATLKQTPTVIGWIFQNPLIVFAVGIILVLLWVIVFLGYQLPNRPSGRIVKHRYTARLSQDNEFLDLRGIPAQLLGRRVKLDEVFIPLLFRPTPHWRNIP